VRGCGGDRRAAFVAKLASRAAIPLLPPRLIHHVRRHCQSCPVSGAVVAIISTGAIRALRAITRPPPLFLRIHPHHEWPYLARGALEAARGLVAGLRPPPRVMGSCCSTATTEAQSGAAAPAPEFDGVASAAAAGDEEVADVATKGAARGAWARGAPNATATANAARTPAAGTGKKTVVTATATSSASAAAPPPPRLFPPQSSWRSFTGTVVHVADGDTCEVADDDGGKRTRVRFAFVDAPESKQSFGPEARAMLAGLVLRQHVTVYVTQVSRGGGGGFGRVYIAPIPPLLLHVHALRCRWTSTAAPSGWWWRHP